VETGGIRLGLAEKPPTMGEAIEFPSLRALAFLTGARDGELLSETGRYLWSRHA
jgi:hypothetical protein